MTVPTSSDLSRNETTMTATVATSVAPATGRIVRPAALAALAAFAVTTWTAAPAAAQSATATDAWIKVCRTDEKAKKEICKTAYDLRTSGGQFLASISVVEVSGEARKILEMIMPTNLLLQPGLKVQVDQNKAEDAKFTLCASDGCVSQLSVAEAFTASLKKGGSMSIVAYGPAANPVTFTVPLDSFKAANEGKSLDDEALKKRDEAIAAEIQAKQKSIEDQMREAQHKAQQAKP